MRRKSVSSSAVSSVGYDSKSKTLEVEFCSGAVWDYHEVPRKVYESLLAAESIGRFFSQEVRGRYPAVRVDE